MQQQPIIQVQNLAVRYNSKDILTDINFVVQEGEVFVILGGSGSGKTTLLSHMVGLKFPYKGTVYIDGADIVTADEKERLHILQKIGVMYQGGALFGSMNLLENIKLPLSEFSDLPIDAINAIAQNKLDMVGLAEFATYMPAELSGGMQKRAAIARAMALDPKILFLDEPSAGLDPVTAAQLDNLIIDLARILGITFVIVSHELASIYKIAQRVIMLHNGKIMAEGDPKELKHDTANEAVYKFFNRVS